MRDIESCLGDRKQKFYYMGVQGSVSRPAINNANKQRRWTIYADLTYSQSSTVRKLDSGKSFAFALDHAV